MWLKRKGYVFDENSYCAVETQFEAAVEKVPITGLLTGLSYLEMSLGSREDPPEVTRLGEL